MILYTPKIIKIGSFFRRIIQNEKEWAFLRHSAYACQLLCLELRIWSYSCLRHKVSPQNGEVILRARRRRHRDSHILHSNTQFVIGKCLRRDGWPAELLNYAIRHDLRNVSAKTCSASHLPTTFDC